MAPRVLGVAAGGLIVLTNVRTIMLSIGLGDIALLAPMLGLLVGWIVLVAWTVRRERARGRAERAAAVPEVEPVAA
jgi:hypothetical protein